MWPGRQRTQEVEERGVQFQEVEHLGYPRPCEPVEPGQVRLVDTSGVELPPELLGQGERLLDGRRCPDPFLRPEPPFRLKEVDDDVAYNSPARGAVGEQDKKAAKAAFFLCRRGNVTRRDVATSSSASSSSGREASSLPTPIPSMMSSRPLTVRRTVVEKERYPYTSDPPPKNSRPKPMLTTLRLRHHGELAREALGVETIHTVAGGHFFQEDSPAEIAEHVSRLVKAR